MIKRLLLCLAATLCAGLASYADVHVKNLDGTNVEISFTYKDDAAKQMNVIGSFDGWTVPGEPMTKNAAGLWEFTLKALATDEIQYKFYNSGTWIFDFKAPDKKDDGFGGNNGLIVVADLLAGGGAPAASASAGAAAAPARKKVSFGTLTFLESDTTLNVAHGAFAATDSSIVAKSLWKFSGDLTTGMPGYFELTFFNGSSSVWNTSGLSVNDGLQGLASGLVFNPFYYLGASKRPTVDKFRFGFDTPYVGYETGYGNVYFPSHTSVIWDTVVDSSAAATPIYAGSGYSAFRLGASLQKLGDFDLEAALVPNRVIDTKFGLMGFASIGKSDWKVELQYEMRSLTTSDPSLMFQDIPRQDLILGGQYFIDQLSLKGQFLLSMFAAGSSVDSLSVLDKVAGEVNVGYKDFFDVYGLSLDCRYRGSVAQSLYMDDGSMLGAAGTQNIGIDGFYRVGHWVIAKASASATLQNTNTASSDISLSLTPGVGLDFSVPARRPLTADLYGKLRYDTVPATPSQAFGLVAAGAKVSIGELVPGLVEGLDVYYGLNNTLSSAMFNSLIAEAILPGNLKVQIGFGLRGASSVANPFAAVAGVSWKATAPQAKDPTLYCQFLYGMDPYDSDGRYVFAFDSNYAYLPAGGAAKYDGSGALRLGLKWEF